jgi:hypothetical protein
MKYLIKLKMHLPMVEEEKVIPETASTRQPTVFSSSPPTNSPPIVP